MSELLARSFLFEIVDKKTNKIDKSFTLIIPPQSVSIKESQRVAITKTFRNMHVDDYGADNLEITIKGYTGTAHVFPTYSSIGFSVDNMSLHKVNIKLNPAIQGFDQRNAFFTFRNDIIRYKDRKGWDKKEFRLYDLYDEQAYRCILLDFSLDRTSANPLRYPYSINLMVYERLDKFTFKEDRIKISKNPFSALNVIDNMLNVIEDKYRLVNDIVNVVAVAKNQALLVRARLNSFLAQTKQGMEAPLTIIKQLIDINLIISTKMYEMIEKGATTFDAYNSGVELIQESIRNSLAIYGFAITQGSQTSKAIIVDTGIGLIVDENREIIPDVSPEVYSFTGLLPYLVKGTDTLQSIAVSELGDTFLWPNIASINNIVDNSELIVGSVIYIPTQADVIDPNADIYVISEDVLRDPYGSDLQIDNNGNLIVQENGDLAVITGVDNVIQAIDMRLMTDVGSVITQTAYGLISGVGIAGTTMALSYIRMNLKASLIQDSRIEDIKNIETIMNKSKIQIAMDVNVVGYDQSIPVTALL